MYIFSLRNTIQSSSISNREHLPRQPDYLYRDAIPAQRETLSIDPLYINEKEYQAYGLGARQELPPAVPVATVTSATALGSYANDPYYAYRHPQFL